MNSHIIAGNSDEARLIVETIVNTEEDADLILECLELSHLTGDKLTSYFEDNFAESGDNYEDDIHMFAMSIKGAVTSHRL